MKKDLCLITMALAMFTAWTFGSLWAATAGQTQAGRPAVQAGVAAAVKGDVKATTPPETAAHVLKSGDKVFMGDTIETGADGHLQVMLLDQTVFTLGPSSTIKVDEFMYDPSSDDGKVKASVLKGIFRVMSGKVAHKKPENMSVELPAGAIGFRGTNVAGIIDGSKSTVVLLGPVGVGRIFVNNLVNGQIVAVDINEAGFATIVDGPNSAPVPVFQVSEADLARIAAALGQGMTGGAPTTTGDISSGNASGGGVDTEQLLDVLNTSDNLNQTSVVGAQDAAQQSAKDASDDHKKASEPPNPPSGLHDG